MSTIVFEGGVDNLRTLADNSLRVNIGTPELSPDTVAKLYSCLKQPGYIVISTTAISQKQIDAVERAAVDRECENKTPSQRLRNALYVWWEKEQPSEIDINGVSRVMDFDLFYRRQMNKLIEFVKAKF